LAVKRPMLTDASQPAARSDAIRSDPANAGRREGG
jgi:hypothetical protein